MKRIKCFLVASIIALSANAQMMDKDVYDNSTKYARLLTFINAYYVDTTNLTQLTEKAIVTLLQNLDPHSTYISAEEVKAANEPLEGNFEGIGVEFSILNDTLMIVSPISGGPSESVGIRAGDRIIAVDKENIAGIGIKNEQVFKLLRGNKGTKVELTIVRKGTSKPMSFTVIRDKIPIHSVEAAYEIEPGVVYIRLSRFAITSLAEMEEAMGKFTQPVTSMVLDLRTNTGGVLKTAIDLCDQFLSEGRLMVYNEGDKWPKSLEIATRQGFFEQGKLIVLIDEHSASASEIVAGAVQDWDRGIIIGRRSFGKGLVQQMLPLPDGSQIRLTVARYHTPTGRIIQRPYDAGKVEDYYKELYQRYDKKEGEVYNSDKVNFPDSLKYITLVNERTVYGGGGIMPDIFMPQDTSWYSDYYGKINRAGLFGQFVNQYMDKERDKLKKQYKTFAAFDNNFEVSEKLFNEFIAYVEAQKIPLDEKGLAISKENMQVQLKALIARSIWDTSEYFETINKRIDEVFLKAMDVLKNWDEYEKEYLL